MMHITNKKTQKIPRIDLIENHRLQSASEMPNAREALGSFEAHATLKNWRAHRKPDFLHRCSIKR